jgi:hypothetical protein
MTSTLCRGATQPEAPEPVDRAETLACDVAQMHHAAGVAVTIDEVGLATLGWVQ